MNFVRVLSQIGDRLLSEKVVEDRTSSEPDEHCHPSRNSEKKIFFPYCSEPEKAQIIIEGGEHLHREIRERTLYKMRRAMTVSLKKAQA
jgi:hypothetical protein